MLTNLLQVSYQFIDSLWVGNLLGGSAPGAVTISSTVIVTLLSFIIGINHATLTILSQQRGRRNDEGLKSYLNAFVVVLSTLSILAGTIGYFYSEDILMLLDTPLEMMPGATAYLRVNLIGILFLLGYNFISSVLRAMGDSKTPLKFVILKKFLSYWKLQMMKGSPTKRKLTRFSEHGEGDIISIKQKGRKICLFSFIYGFCYHFFLFAHIAGGPNQFPLFVYLFCRPGLRWESFLLFHSCFSPPSH
jgi:hypothetical protein